MKVLLLSRYMELGASSRYRSYQYLPFLRSQGIDVHVSPLLSDLYLRRLYSGESSPKFDLLRSHVARLRDILRAHRYDLVWLEYEVFPWLPFSVESLLLESGVPYIVDYDDAIFHRYDLHPSTMIRLMLGKKIGGVMRNASLVLVGNEYLAAYARDAGAKQVEILPTVIDLNRYPRRSGNVNTRFTIGWIGTPMTSHYLDRIADVLREVCSDGRARVMAVGPQRLSLTNIPHEIRQWKTETEVQEVQNFDVGIMPLIDSPWERGKCGHKLIQYMACGKPVVASPVGVNSEIVEHGVNGFLASTREEWAEALAKIRDDRELREKMGEAGRKKVEKQYSLQITAPRLAALFRLDSKQFVTSLPII